MPGSLLAQPEQIYSSQHSQHHTQANAFPSQQELNNNWIKVSYKRGRSAQDETETKNQTLQRKRTLAQPHFQFQSLHSSTGRGK
jgi:23S rRNA maturation mini-RNase III